MVLKKAARYSFQLVFHDQTVTWGCLQLLLYSSVDPFKWLLSLRTSLLTASPKSKIRTPPNKTTKSFRRFVPFGFVLGWALYFFCFGYLFCLYITIKSFPEQSQKKGMSSIPIG